jgi:diacylglycerol kinase
MFRLFKSCRYAAQGFAYAFKTQLNFKVHAAAALFVVWAGWYVGLAATEWMMIAFCIAAVVAAELMNTAIELLVDLVSPEFNARAGKVKDLAAAAVLMVAVVSLVVGLFIFVPKLI